MTSRALRMACSGIAGLGVLACQVRGLIGSNAIETGANETTEFESETGRDTGTSTDLTRLDLGILDVPSLPDACVPIVWPACDDQDDDPWHAIGLSCGDEADQPVGFGHPIDSSITGDPQAVGVHRGRLGTTDAFLPREGEKVVVLSTGKAAHLRLRPDQIRTIDPAACTTPSKCPSTVFSEDRRTVLPPPLEVRNVARNRNCIEDPSLVGLGDCSNTLQDQWSRGQGAVDYVEMRFTTVVPPRTSGLTYQFVFFSSEYPLWAAHDNAWNDIYVAWLESEAWTGNISFDAEGNPITVNSVLIDYQAGDDPETCEAVAQVPELEGFAMQCHGGTRWLRTTAPVVPGETIELVFALFDLTDGELDSFVLLDNFHWTCSGDAPLTEIP